MKKFMKKNNKGFSLVELIVVIAIMAILVGVLAPTVMGQIEKSRYSADVTALDGVYTALQAAIADPASAKEINQAATNGVWTGTLDTLLGYTNAKAVLSENTPLVNASFTFDNSGLKSTAFAGISATDVVIRISNGTPYVKVTSKSTKYNDFEAGQE